MKTCYFNRIIKIALLVFLLLLLPSLGYAAPPNQGPLPPDKLIEQLNQETSNQVRISFHAETGYVRFIGTTLTQTIKQSPGLRGKVNVTAEDIVRDFLNVYGSLFGLNLRNDELQTLSERSLKDGRTVFRLQQAYQEIPIIGGELVIQVGVDNNIISASGEILPNLSLSVVPSIDAAIARDQALNTTAQKHNLSTGDLMVTEPKLWIYSPLLLGSHGGTDNRLVWRVEVSSVDQLPINELVLIDARTDELILQLNQIPHALNRVIYDNDNDRSAGLPGTGPVRNEGDTATGIVDVDLAYDYSGDTYGFYLIEHGRDSLNGAGMTLISTVRYCKTTGSCPYQNAFWNGSQMVYGQGFAAADDVVGHELTHGVTDFTSDLIYAYQSGAINESFSDVWGELIDLDNGAGDDSAGVRWLMGEDLPVGEIRDMADPPNFNHPDRMSSQNYRCVPLSVINNDNGGVHTNSGVNNKAAYLLVDGDSFNNYTITGMGIPRVADLYYEAQTNLLTSGANYADLYDALIQACSNLEYSNNECTNVENALKAVEMHREIVYVDLNAPNKGNSSCQEGLRTVNAGVTAVPDEGIVWIAAGNYNETVIINQPMSLQSTGGTVTITGQ